MLLFSYVLLDAYTRKNCNKMKIKVVVIWYKKETNIKEKGSLF